MLKIKQDCKKKLYGYNTDNHNFSDTANTAIIFQMEADFTSVRTMEIDMCPCFFEGPGADIYTLKDEEPFHD
jgi:alkyl hydroperoxide reductase subunit AhpC